MPVGAPMDRLATDVLGPLPVTPRGNYYILLVTNHFTKWVEIFAIPDQTAVTCAEVILNEVISRFGCPLTIYSDQGKNYESQIFAELCKLLEIQKTRTSPGNPRGNGLAERFNRTMVKMIKSFLHSEQLDWDRHLGCLAGAYRSSVHDSTGVTPNMLILGREVQCPTDLIFGVHEHELCQNYGEYVSKLKERLQHAHDIVRAHLQTAQQRQKDQYDLKLKLQKYNVGDLVWLETDISQLDVAPKLHVLFEGPYMVYRKLSDLDYELYMVPKKFKLVHHNRLKPYDGLQKPAGYYSALAKLKKQNKSTYGVDQQWLPIFNFWFP